MENIKTLVEILFFSVSTVAVCVSIFTYRRSVRIRKSEWLNALFEKYYENERYKRIRKILDYRDIDHKEYDSLKGIIKKLLSGDKNLDDTEITFMEELVDYLNFFELIGSFVELNQLKHKEVKLMFEYYLNMIKEIDFLVEYLRFEGFERPISLLNKI